MASKYSKRDPKTYTWLRCIPHYFTIFFILYPFYKLWFRIKVYGRENIPKGENLLIAANHISYFDPTIISLAMLKPIAYMAKEELFKVPILSQLIIMYGAFAVDRSSLEVATIKTAKAIIARKWHVSLFPEGTRGNGITIKKIHKGMGFLAKTTKTRVLPLSIMGSNKPHGPIIVKIGKPIDIAKDPEEMAQKWLDSIIEMTGLKLEENQVESKEKEEALKQA